MRLILCVIILVVTVIGIGHLDTRLASSLADDHPSSYSDLFINSSRYLGDEFSYNGVALAKASFQNWGTYLLSILTQIPSENLSLIWVFLQNTLMVLFFFRVAKTLSENPIVQLGICLLSFGIHPWEFNLAQYPGFIYVPYPGQLATSILLHVLLDVVQNKHKRALGLLLLSGLTHPSLSLLTFGVCLILIFRVESFQNQKRLYFSCLVILFLFLTPSFYLMGVQINPLTNLEIIEDILANRHFVPWNYSNYWAWSMPATILWMGLGVLSLLSLNSKNQKPYKIFLVLIPATLIYVICHLIGVKLKIVPLIQICPSRFSALTSTFFTPFIVSFIIEKLDKDFFYRISIVIFLGLILISKSFFWAPILFLGFSSKLTQRVFLGCSVLLLFAYLMARYFNFEVTNLAILFLAPGKRVSATQIFLIFILGVVFSSVYKQTLRQKTYLILVVSILVNLSFSFSEAQSVFRGVMHDRYLVQKWARESTDETARFFVRDSSWRSYARRGCFFIRTTPFNLHVYTRSRQSKELQTKYEADLNQYKKKDFLELNGEEVAEMGKRWNVSYLVLGVDSPPYQFPVVYENDSFKVFRLGK